MRLIIVLGFLAFIALGGTAYAQNPLHQVKMAKLEQALNKNVNDDKILTLTEGTDFEGPPGTVIFASLQTGQDKLIKIARAGQPELSVMFLPEWEVWITQTTVRNIYTLKIDHKYIEAALVTGMAVQNWHTHNNVSNQELTENELYQKSIQWTMPSPTDLTQFWEFAHDMIANKLTGVIANTHGITSYWNRDSKWAAPLYTRYAVQQEANLLYEQTSKLKLAELPQFAKNHNGFMKIKFVKVK